MITIETISLCAGISMLLLPFIVLLALMFKKIKDISVAWTLFAGGAVFIAWFYVAAMILIKTL